MATGRYRLRGKYNLSLVNFGSASHEVDEQTYRRMEYLPEFENLP
jgi:hypothetical protein